MRGRLDYLIERAIALQHSGTPLLEALRFVCDRAIADGATQDEVTALWNRGLDTMAARPANRDALDVLIAVWEIESQPSAGQVH